MAVPRQILPGETYLVSRRCAQRRFLLRPSRQVNRIFRFCLACAAQRFGIRLHAYCALSNHYHLVLTDVDGRLPEFMHWLNEYVAKAVNGHLGRWESFWAPGSYSAVRLLDLEDRIAKLVYVYTNPVTAGLVRKSSQWPGARSLPRDLVRPPVRVERPVGFFREKGPVPASALLELWVPEGLGANGEDAVALLERAVREREAEIRRSLRARGVSFLGVRRVLRQSPFGRPRGLEPRRGMNPRVAGRDRWGRIEALQRLKEFLADYRLARRRYLDGEREVCFPRGTYWMRVRLGVQCCGP